MKGILINYEYCTGCHSCEVACRNELELAKGEFGIKLTEVGPYKYETKISSDTPYEWVYNPTITKACDLCESRTEAGKMPSCVQACQAWCMYYGEVEDLAKRMDGKTRWALYTPIQGDARAASWEMGGGAAPAAHAATPQAKTAEKRATEASVESTYHETRGKMEVNVTFRGPKSSLISSISLPPSTRRRQKPSSSTRSLPMRKPASTHSQTQMRTTESATN